MSSKPEPKDTHQLNGTGPAASACSSEGPSREPLAGTSEFLGPDGAEVEVVVPESRANAKGLREEDALLENGSQSNESDDVSTDHGPTAPSPLKETSFSIGLQVLFPFLLAGFGTVAAGMVLDIVQVGSGRVALDPEPGAVFSSWETVSWSFSSTSLSEAAAASWNPVSLWIMSSVSSSSSPFLQKTLGIPVALGQVVRAVLLNRSRVDSQAQAWKRRWNRLLPAIPPGHSCRAQPTRRHLDHVPSL